MTLTEPNVTARHEEEARQIMRDVAASNDLSLRDAIASALAEARAAGRAEAAEIVKGMALEANREIDAGNKHADYIGMALAHERSGAHMEALNKIRSLAAAPQKEANMPEPPEGSIDARRMSSAEVQALCKGQMDGFRRGQEWGMLVGEAKGRTAALQEAARMAREEANASASRGRTQPESGATALYLFADKLTALAASGAVEQEHDAAVTAEGTTRGASTKDRATSADLRQSAGPDSVTSPAAEREARRERAREFARHGAVLIDVDIDSISRDLAVFAEAELARILAPLRLTPSEFASIVSQRWDIPGVMRALGWASPDESHLRDHMEIERLRAELARASRLERP